MPIFIKVRKHFFISCKHFADFEPYLSLFLICLLFLHIMTSIDDLWLFYLTVIKVYSIIRILWNIKFFCKIIHENFDSLLITIKLNSCFHSLMKKECYSSLFGDTLPQDFRICVRVGVKIVLSTDTQEPTLKSGHTLSLPCVALSAIVD